MTSKALFHGLSVSLHPQFAVVIFFTRSQLCSKIMLYNINPVSMRLCTCTPIEGISKLSFQCGSRGCSKIMKDAKKGCVAALPPFLIHPLHETFVFCLYV